MKNIVFTQSLCEIPRAKWFGVHVHFISFRIKELPRFVHTLRTWTWTLCPAAHELNATPCQQPAHTHAEWFDNVHYIFSLEAARTVTINKSLRNAFPCATFLARTYYTRTVDSTIGAYSYSTVASRGRTSVKLLPCKYTPEHRLLYMP